MVCSSQSPMSFGNLWMITLLSVASACVPDVPYPGQGRDGGSPVMEDRGSITHTPEADPTMTTGEAAGDATNAAGAGASGETEGDAMNASGTGASGNGAGDAMNAGEGGLPGEASGDAMNAGEGGPSGEASGDAMNAGASGEAAGNAMGGDASGAAAGAMGSMSDGMEDGMAAPMESSMESSMEDGMASPMGPCTNRAQESVCEGNVLHRCDGAGSSAMSETCMNAALCQTGRDSGTCAQCAPGAFSCDGPRLRVCSDSGQWTDKEQCATAALCKASAGACTERVCTPNATTCDASGNLLRCNADGSEFASRDACGAGLCDAFAGRCNRCVPGAETCRGDTLVVCSQDGQSEREQACSPRGECWTAGCTGGACQQSPRRRSSRCEGSGYCDGAGACDECTSDAHCSDLNDDCNDGVCRNGSCRAQAKARGQRCRNSPGLCDRGTCRDVECLSASDCSDRDASCTEGECVVCGDGKIGPGEECEIGAPKKAGDQLLSSNYDRFSCDEDRCERLYIWTPCRVDTGLAPSSECGGRHRCSGNACIPSAGCGDAGQASCTLPNGESNVCCTLPNERPGTCYSSQCFVLCDGQGRGDCPAGFSCNPDSSIGRFCAPQQ